VPAFKNNGIEGPNFHPTHLPFPSSSLTVPATQPGFVYPSLHRLNSWVCRLMYGVAVMKPFPIPTDGPALIVCDHTSMGDPLVLLATAGRPIRFLMANEIYAKSHIRWVFRAFRCIPVQRGRRDIRAIRTMLEGLAAQEVIGLFPEGGLDRRHRLNAGHLGVGYLAIKSGAPVIPASIVWDGPHSVTSMLKT
jgi:1-acyl-sn-glycerol-3-phosphate acyltransferase